jgi:RNA polymerase sigma factor (sigma-70 family)
MNGRWVEAEFEAIFREHYGRIVRVIRRVLQRDSEAEEVCAEVFLRLYRTGSGVATDGLVGAWLYRTATRASIDALRTHRRRGAEIEDDGKAESRQSAAIAFAPQRPDLSGDRSGHAGERPIGGHKTRAGRGRVLRALRTASTAPP